MEGTVLHSTSIYNYTVEEGMGSGAMCIMINSVHPPIIAILFRSLLSPFTQLRGKLRALPIYAHAHFVELFMYSLLVVSSTLGDVPRPRYEVSSFSHGISSRTQSRRWPITTGRITSWDKR